MDGFKSFPPEPRVLAAAGSLLELTPIRLGELPRLLATVRPIASKLAEDPDWIALLSEHGQTVLDLLVITTRRDRAWVEALSLEEAVQVAAAAFEVNADFFVARVVPAIHAATSQLGPKLQSLGTTPSPS